MTRQATVLLSLAGLAMTLGCGRLVGFEPGDDPVAEVQSGPVTPELQNDTPPVVESVDASADVGVVIVVDAVDASPDASTDSSSSKDSGGSQGSPGFGKGGFGGGGHGFGGGR